ncbi:MAG: hypothetical protein QXD23_01970 [Candidatus Micrarchaeaceae archaeon]
MSTKPPIVRIIQDSNSKVSTDSSNSYTISLINYYRSEISILTRKNPEALSAFDLCMSSFPEKEKLQIAYELVELAEKSGLEGRSKQLIITILKNVKRKNSQYDNLLLKDLKSIANTKSGNDPLTFFYMAKKFKPETISGAELEIENIFKNISEEKSKAVVKRVKEILKLQ